MKSSLDRPLRVGLATLGCKVAQYETEAIAEAFEKKGFSVTDFDSLCDVYVVNTCTVTADADRKSRQMIRRAIRRAPNAVVMAAGCYAQNAPRRVAAIEGVAYVTGNERKMQLPDRALQLLKEKREAPFAEAFDVQNAPFEEMRITRAPRTRAYVKIEDGCGAHCTYCAIAAARGRVRSKPIDAVIDEVNALYMGGTREVVLTGIETAAYGQDLGGADLLDLLEAIDRETDIERIRLGSMAPEFFRPERIERLSRIACLAPHLHLSVQSGSAAVLRRMKRRYNADFLKDSILLLKRHIDGMELTADFIVGFPAETEDEFAETLALAREAAFLDMHVFTYSKRAGTPAATYEGQVPEDVKRERSRRLMALGQETKRERLALAAAAPLQSVLFEQRDQDGNMVGHTPSFIPVAVRTTLDLHGQIRTVTELSAEKDRLTGRLCKPL